MNRISNFIDWVTDSTCLVILVSALALGGVGTIGYFVGFDGGAASTYDAWNDKCTELYESEIALRDVRQELEDVRTELEETRHQGDRFWEALTAHAHEMRVAQDKVFTKLAEDLATFEGRELSDAEVQERLATILKN